MGPGAPSELRGGIAILPWAGLHSSNVNAWTNTDRSINRASVLPTIDLHHASGTTRLFFRMENLLAHSTFNAPAVNIFFKSVPEMEHIYPRATSAHCTLAIFKNFAPERDRCKQRVAGSTCPCGEHALGR